MTTEKLTKALYKKMENELEQFTNWLLTQPPQVILDHVFEYATKCDILSIFEDFHLAPKAAEALLNLDKPMDAVWQEYGNSSSNSMDVLVSFVFDKAEELASTAHDTSKPSDISNEKYESTRKSTSEKLKTPSPHSTSSKHILRREMDR